MTHAVFTGWARVRLSPRRPHAVVRCGFSFIREASYVDRTVRPPCFGARAAAHPSLETPAREGHPTCRCRGVSVSECQKSE